jgi:DinB family protein
MHAITSELLQYLDEQRTVLKSAFESVPPEMRDRLPAPERWSPANIVEHLAIVEARVAKLLSGRIDEARSGLAGQTSTAPILPSIDYKRMYDRSTRVKAPETALPTGLDASSAWSALENAGSMMRAMLIANDGLELSSVTHPHPRFGVLSVYEWVALLGAHEVRHADQIREETRATFQAPGS